MVHLLLFLALYEIDLSWYLSFVLFLWSILSISICLSLNFILLSSYSSYTLASLNFAISFVSLFLLYIAYLLSYVFISSFFHPSYIIQFKPVFTFILGLNSLFLIFVCCLLFSILLVHLSFELSIIYLFLQIMLLFNPAINWFFSYNFISSFSLLVILSPILTIFLIFSWLIMYLLLHLLLVLLFYMNLLLALFLLLFSIKLLDTFHQHLFLIFHLISILFFYLFFMYFVHCSFLYFILTHDCIYWCFSLILYAYIFFISLLCIIFHHKILILILLLNTQ